MSLRKCNKCGFEAKKYNHSLYFMVCTTVLLVSLFRLSLGLNNIYLVSMVS